MLSLILFSVFVLGNSTTTLPNVDLNVYKYYTPYKGYVTTPQSEYYRLIWRVAAGPYNTFTEAFYVYKTLNENPTVTRKYAIYQIKNHYYVITYQSINYFEADKIASKIVNIIKQPVYLIRWN